MCTPDVKFAYVPQFRAWLYVAIGFWAVERVARLVQLLSVTLLRSFILRHAFIQADAQLIEGAIVLRVPFHASGGWTAGQHAYLSFWDAGLLRRPHLFAQTHPFSIANIPSEFNNCTQLFVMRIHGGVTKSLAAHLADVGGSAKLRVCLEGPYGSERGASASMFDNVLLVAGGSGITHCLSHLSDVVAKAKLPASRTTKITLVWSVQHLGESISWCKSSSFN